MIFIHELVYCTCNTIKFISGILTHFFFLNTKYTVNQLSFVCEKLSQGSQYYVNISHCKQVVVVWLVVITAWVWIRLDREKYSSQTSLYMYMAVFRFNRFWIWSVVYIITSLRVHNRIVPGNLSVSVKPFSVYIVLCFLNYCIYDFRTVLRCVDKNVYANKIPVKTDWLLQFSSSILK